MVNGVPTLPHTERELIRENSFSQIWSKELDKVFTDLAHYYDRANNVASLGLLPTFLDKFMSMVELQSGQRALDVCAGTNVIGIALKKKQPDLEVFAIDRSRAMQTVGLERAKKQGISINSTISDVHKLPFPDDHFDIVTLQYASRHLRVVEVFSEIRRVLKPGGHFYHSDMLRPSNSVVEKIHYCYLWTCLTVTGWIFRSSDTLLNSRKYFMDAISQFYSADELSDLLKNIGFEDVSSKSLMGGLVGFHRAVNRK